MSGKHKRKTPELPMTGTDAVPQTGLVELTAFLPVRLTDAELADARARRDALRDRLGPEEDELRRLQDMVADEREVRPVRCEVVGRNLVRRSDTGQLLEMRFLGAAPAWDGPRTAKAEDAR